MVGKVQTRPQQRSSWIVPAWLPFPPSHPEFFSERLRCPRRPIASDHFSGPLERMTFGGVIADADNDIPMERACGGGTRRLQRMAHGCGQIVGMVVHRHENLQPAPKGGHQAARPGLIGARSSLT